MSKTSIPQKVKNLLWIHAGGRCEYRGCNEALWKDTLTMAAMNKAYIAHIIADSSDGPRGDESLSPKLSKELSNLMLMCDTHHRLIDQEMVTEHPVDILTDMKKEHEERIQTLTSISPATKTHILLYGANIGNNPASDLSWEKASLAISDQGRYPANKPAIEIGMKNSMMMEHDDHYWDFEQKNLTTHLRDLKTQLGLGSINHISVFALAPQPLLISLGIGLSDIADVDVYQLHREPKTWQWQDNDDTQDFLIVKPKKEYETVALNLSLSANIENQRIHSVLGDNTSIWTITVPMPHNDFLESKKQLQLFRKKLRELFNEMKLIHGSGTLLHVFPAAPIAISIEIGRVWMPKADLSMKVYDEIKGKGFVEALLFS